MRRRNALSKASTFLGGILVCGCAGQGGYALRAGDGGAYPAPVTSHVLSLPAATGEGPEATVIELPSRGRWPLSFGGKGPLYAFVSLAPYVGQLGTLADTDRADAGTGWGLNLGWRMPLAGSRTLGFELIVETSSHFNPTSDVDGTANRIAAGARLSFRADEKIVPFALVGGGMYELRFPGLGFGTEFAGPGIFIGGGVDFVLAKSFTARLEMNFHVWDAADERGHGGVAETITIGLGVGTSF